MIPMKTEEELIRSIRNSKWKIDPESILKKGYFQNLEVAKKGIIKLYSADAEIAVDWIPLRKVWIIKVYKKVSGKKIFIESEADSFRYMLHLIKFHMGHFADWQTFGSDFIRWSSESVIHHDPYDIKFEEHYLLYLDKSGNEIKRLNLGFDIIKFRDLPGKGILILLDDINQKYFFNLYLLSYDGKKKWKAQWPIRRGVFLVKDRVVAEKKPDKGFSTIIVKKEKVFFFSKYSVYANSSNFLCKINPRNGRIIRKEFVK